MRVLARVLGGIALLLLAVLAIGEALPGRWHAEAEGSVDVAPDSVATVLARVRSWKAWMAWPETGAHFTGPAFGPGASFRWNDPTYGSGRFTITDSEPGRSVDYRVEVEGGSIRVKGRIGFRSSSEGTRLQWTEDGSVGWNPLLGYVAMGMGERQTTQLEDALERLVSYIQGDEEPD